MFLLRRVNMLSSKPISVLWSCLFTVLPFLGLSQHLGMHDRTFYKLSDKSLVGNVTATWKVKDCFHCAFLCLRRGPFACLSFNLGNNEGNGYHTCELSNSERYLEPLGMQERINFNYYGLTTEVSWYSQNAKSILL